MSSPGAAEGLGQYYTVRPTSDKGNGAFALQDIVAGTRVLLENPILMIDKPGKDIAVVDVVKAFRTLPSAAQSQFMDLFVCHSRSRGFNDLLWTKYQSNKWTTISDREGCFEHGSRFNHSCLPNAAITPTAGPQFQLQGYVFKDVKAGEELTVSYDENYNYMTWAERATELATSGNQGIEVCACSHCKLQPEDRLVSDMRRTLMRHMIYACTNPVEADCGILPGVSAEFCAQRQAVGNQPGGRHLVELLLFTQLAEAEGVATGRMPRLFYSQAASAVLCWARDMQGGVLTIHQLNNAKKWVGRSLEHKILCRGRDTYDGEEEEVKMERVYQVICMFGADGKLSL